MTHDPRVEAFCNVFMTIIGNDEAWIEVPEDDDKKKIRDGIKRGLAAADAARRNPVAEAMAYEAGEEAGRMAVESRNSDHILKMEKEIASLKAAPQSHWRDIKDAPRDGVEILCADKDGGRYIVRWQERFLISSDENLYQPAGWYSSPTDDDPIEGLVWFMSLSDLPPLPPASEEG